MRTYIDTSVLLSFFILEKYTEQTQEALTPFKLPMHISNLVETEFYSALAKKYRVKELSLRTINTYAEYFNFQVNSPVFHKIHITTDILNKANEFIRSFNTPIRTLDAMHLAVTDSIDAKILTADKRLAQSAEIFGVPFQLI